MDKYDPNWNKTAFASEDNYWAGAKKACDDIGMSLPDKSKLQSIYEAGQKDSSLGLPTSGWFWASSEYIITSSDSVDFRDGYTGANGKNLSRIKALCVGD